MIPSLADRYGGRPALHRVSFANGRDPRQPPPHMAQAQHHVAAPPRRGVQLG